MRILYIDTSSSYLYTAIVEKEKVLCEIKEEYGTHLSEMALPKIAELFEKTKFDVKDIDKIIVVNGPGSFTGIRIGITIGKVYAWSLNIPITTITSLEAMAISSKEKKFHVPVINARRGYVFTAIYDENDQEVLKPQHIKITDLEKELEKIEDYEIITNDEFEEWENTVFYEPDFEKIIKKYQEKEPINPHAINPEYLKLTEAEENRL